MTERADRELLDGIRGGRRDACARLVHEHYPAIYRFLLHWTYEQALRHSDEDASVVLDRAAPAFAWPVAGSRTAFLSDRSAGPLD